MIFKGNHILSHFSLIDFNKLKIVKLTFILSRSKLSKKKAICEKFIMPMLRNACRDFYFEEWSLP